MSVSKGKRKINIKITCVVIIAIAVLVAFILGNQSTKSEYAFKSIGDQDAAIPSVSSQSAVLYNMDLDEVIYEKDGDARVNPYSTTKLMTAYIALEKLSLDQEVCIKNAGAESSETAMDLVDGEVLTVEELLEGLLVESGNDAARVLAVEAAGSESKFASLMNKQAEEWGCTGTNFVNASGMKADNHYTTVNDYLIITNKVFANKDIKKICSLESVTIPATNKSAERKYTTHTTLRDEDGSGVVCGKTGYWDETDCAVALQYLKKDMNLALVIMGATEDSREADAKALLGYAHEFVPGYIVAKPKTETCKIWVRGGKQTHIPVTVTKTAYAYPKSNSEKDITLKASLCDGIKVPIKKGDVIGTLKVYSDGKLVATKKLASIVDVEKGWFTSYIYLSNLAVVCILLAIFACVIMLFACARIIKKRKMKHIAERKHRRESR